MIPEVAVVGGGIGGLGVALFLFRAGFDVHVYEQAHALREVGAGIQVACRRCRLQIRPVSTCPTDLLSKNGTQKWLQALPIAWVYNYDAAGLIDRP